MFGGDFPFCSSLTSAHQLQLGDTAKDQDGPSHSLDVEDLVNKAITLKVCVAILS